MSAAKKQNGLEFWKKHITEQQMPVLAQTAQAVVNRASDDSSSAADLSRLVLQDASMTTRVLRMANSFYYKPGEGKITTISRAVVLLGFDAVRNICVSISLIDTFLRGPYRDLAVAEMAHCFHSAVQAKSIAELSGQKEPEEVFIATLLYRLGALAFWCFADEANADVADKLQKTLQASVGGTDSEEAIEREILGFGIDELTSSLNQKWGLSPLLTYALDYRMAPTAATRAIGMGHTLAKALAGKTIDRPLEAVLDDIAQTLKIPAADVRSRVESNAQVAAETIAIMGVPEAAKLIPRLPHQNNDVVMPEEMLLDASPEAADGRFSENSQSLQLDILRELASLLDEPKPNVTLMLEMVLEGIFRGVGMDRAVFALLSPDRQQVRAKYALGDSIERLRETFVFDVVEPRSNVIAWAIVSGKTLWFGEPEGILPDALPSAELQRLSGGSFFLMPLSVSGKPVGCLYADRGTSRRLLDAELFSQFKLFGQQARMGLTYLKAG